MAVRSILTYPQYEDILKKKSEPLAFDDPQKDSVIADVRDTLRATENGLGLAAVQIGILRRVFALKRDLLSSDIPQDSPLWKEENNVLVFINPKIISGKGETDSTEGCLSVPNEDVTIKRYKTLKLKFSNEAGEQFHLKFTGLAAIAVQQEMDHLNGLLIIDYAG